MVRPGVLLVAILLASCGDDAPTPSTPPATEAPVAPTPSTPPPPTPPPPTPPPTTPTAARVEHAAALDPAQARAYRTAIAAARRAHRDGHDDEAVRQFEAAFAISRDGRALCELGWIHFEAERYQDARAAMSRAIVLLPADAPVPERFVQSVGACLYNLGRLEEQAGDVAAARDYYARSLAVRPGNRVVHERLGALGAATAAVSAGPTHRCGTADPPIADLDVLVSRLDAVTGPPSAFDAPLGELGADRFDPDRILGFDAVSLDPPPTLDAEVGVGPMRLPGGEGRWLHVSAEHEGNSLDRVVVLRAVAGGFCTVGGLAQDQDACSTACLGDDTAFRVALEQLVAPDVDVLQIETNSGGCACGSERGAEADTRYHGVEGDALVQYGRFIRYSAWYESPVPPMSEAVGRIELSETFPRTITFETEEQCSEGCSTAEVAQRRGAIERAEGEERSDLEMELESDCGYYVEDCTPSTTRVTYRYRNGEYVADE